jgi:hypothetical protein
VTDRPGSGGGQYDQTPACELHALAVRRARRNLDIGFFWELIDALPAGDPNDVGAGAAEPLRPLYIEYLTRKG